ncbi:MAG: hypothetical protein H7Y20_16960 [Bryobacteraceae bacterium]|nr:hypothetical protein [Bryobacteraceae bacterium]
MNTDSALAERSQLLGFGNGLFQVALLSLVIADVFGGAVLAILLEFAEGFEGTVVGGLGSGFVAGEEFPAELCVAT